MIDELMEQMPDYSREEIQVSVYVWEWYQQNGDMFNLTNMYGLDIVTELTNFCQTIAKGKHKELK